MRYFVVFSIFSVISIIFRFAIGNPVTSSRFQTKYKFKSIPDVLNFILFFNTSKKPVSIQIIIFQIQNYIVSLLFFLTKDVSTEFHFKAEACLGFIIVILPLFIEIVLDTIKGSTWKTENDEIELSFEEYQISFLSNNQSIILHFATYIRNEIVFFNDENKIVGTGIIDYKNKTIVISQIDYPIKDMKILFSKQKSSKSQF